jgi:hypothetical protein
VSAANYEARAFGIRAGMMISDAKGRCPGLLVVPYEFEKYEEASLQVRLPDDHVSSTLTNGVCYPQHLVVVHLVVGMQCTTAQ